MLVALYRSPSQLHNKFSSFITNLESTLYATTLRKPFLTMVLGNLNAKNKFWFDQDNTSYEGSILNDLMAQYGLTQIIHKQTHMLESSVSYIDVVLTSPENLVTNSGVHSSLHPNCHHQIVFSNFSLKNLLSTSTSKFNLEIQKSQCRSYKKNYIRFPLQEQTFS